MHAERSLYALVQIVLNRTRRTSSTFSLCAVVSVPVLQGLEGKQRLAVPSHSVSINERHHRNVLTFAEFVGRGY